MAKIKEKLAELTQRAENSGESEYKTLMEFLNDAVASDRGEINKELLIAICDEFRLTATYIKKELTSCQG